MRPVSRRGLIVAGVIGALGEWIGAEWDIAWHGDLGRDRFLTPPHVAISAGIAIVVLVGAAGLWGQRTEVERDAGRSGFGLMTVAGLSQVVTLMVDNWWHGVFGLDVSLWSPPHLVLIALGWLAIVGLLRELVAGGAAHWARLAMVGLLGASGTLVLAEYDYGFPQFRMVYAPLLLAGLIGAIIGLSAGVGVGRWPATTATAGPSVFGWWRRPST